MDTKDSSEHITVYWQWVCKEVNKTTSTTAAGLYAFFNFILEG